MSEKNKKKSQPASPSSLILSLEKQLLAIIQKSDGAFLPSLQKLAAMLDVSHPTLAKAAARLRQNGVIALSQGRRICITAKAPVSLSNPLVSSVEQIAKKLEEQISICALRTGENLPKVAAAALEFNASNTTVLKAYRLLLGKGLVSKKGKLWVVGVMPIEQLQRIQIRTPPRVIIVLQHKEFAWKSLAYSRRTARFFSEFSTEADRFSIRIESAYTSHAQSPLGAKLIGRKRVRELARMLGDRYLGMLIISSRDEIPDISNWATDLASLKKPVVWFDRKDEKLEAPVASRFFTRCHFSEEPAAALAVVYLKEMGHTVAVHPITSPWKKDWQFGRRSLLEKAAYRERLILKTIDEPLPVAKGNSELALRDIYPEIGDALCELSAHNCDSLQNTSDSVVNETEQDSILTRFRAWLQIQGEPQPGARTLLQTRLFKKILRQRDATAIIASHDYSANYFYHWLLLAGIEIPGQISLISFDNDPGIHPIPITTIDFGFGQLGYSAFHVLFGDIPIRQSKMGDIVSQPIVIDRGSVGPPRRGLLRIRADLEKNNLLS